MACVIGLDIGTTSTIGILIRLPDEVLAISSRPVTLISERIGWAEEDPEQWWSNVCAIVPELLTEGGVSADEVGAIGVAGMLPAVVLLDKNGRLLRRSIQQSDGRCGAEVENLRSEIEESTFLAKAGNGINQQLVTAKLRWLEKHEPDLFRGIATVCGSYDYINWRLTSRHTVEQNWALEAGFVDVKSDALDDDLIALAHLPRGAIPAKVASHEIIGHVSPVAAKESGLAAGTPVVGGAADMIASALAAGVTQRGQALLKFGGSVDVLIATDQVIPDPRLYLDYHLVPGLFMPNGCMATGGSALNWFAASFGGAYAEKAKESDLSLHQLLDRMAENRSAGSDGVLILPYFLGEKTPLHNPSARGVIEGLTLSHDAGHVWRALLESYAYAIAHHLDVLRDMGHDIAQCIASDGGSRSKVWMQIVADVLQQPVQRLAGHPGSCLGAAWTAAVGTGLAPDWTGISAFVREDDVLQPNPSHAEPYRLGYARYRDLYCRLESSWAAQ